MTDEQMDRLAISLKAGEYNLLLGAAASLGSRGGDNHPLPLADDLRVHLCNLVGAKSSHPLQRVYQSLDSDQVEREITGRFSGCKAGPALTGLTGFIWKRVFTLNVDDAFEDAYASGDPYQRLIVRNYRDAFEETRDSASLPVVHLHGFAQRPQDGYVFSRDAYIDMVKTINPWMVVLSQIMASEPFMIIGSSLDEPDLDYFLSLRSQAGSRLDRGPSILVEPFGDAITDRECERLDLVKFPGTAEEFVKFLNDRVIHRPRPHELVPAEDRDIFASETSTADLSAFFADFERVPFAAEVNTHDSRFFYGHAPSWSDLTLQYDVARVANATVTRKVDASFADPAEPRVVFISDNAGYGKTTSLRRLGFDYARQGVTVLSCFASSRLEPVFTSRMLNGIAGRCLVLVDNFADQVYSIESILSHLEKTDIVFLAAERAYRYRFITEVLGGAGSRNVRVPGISDLEADQLIQTYVEAGIVGDEEYIKNRGAAIRQLVDEPIAVACCRILNNLRPLDRIIQSIIQASTKFDKKRYLISALSQFCTQSGIKYDLLLASGGPAGINGQFNAIHPMPLAYSTEKTRNYIVPLNGTLGKRVLELIAGESPDEMLDAFVSLGRAVAPRVNRRTIVARTPEARLAARLFDYDQVVSIYLGERALEFYEDVEDEWRWNSRYWEQVALLNLARYQADRSNESAVDSLNAAISHSRHAVSIERHPLTLTTLAKIQMVAVNAGERFDEATFAEAVENLREAIRIESRRSRVSIQPFMVLFNGVLTVPDPTLVGDLAWGFIREFMLTAKRTFARDAEMQGTLTLMASKFEQLR
jgi:hypothetical protein